MRITLNASGDYAYEVPESLMTALAESVRSHMAAYGLTGAVATVEIEPAVKDCLTGGEPSGEEMLDWLNHNYGRERKHWYGPRTLADAIRITMDDQRRAAMKEKP